MNPPHGLPLLLLASAARAQELVRDSCSSPTATASTPPAAAVAAARWADVGLALAVLALGAAAILYVRANERWRREARAFDAPIERAPYACGAALGLLSASSLVFLGHPVGVSGGVAAILRGDWSWPAWLVVGLLGGGFLGAAMGRRLRIQLEPPAAWSRAHGPSVGLRLIVVLVAAALIEVAALVAGGCTSGLALSGGVILAPGAFLFMAAMFATGIPTAKLVARHPRRRP